MTIRSKTNSMSSPQQEESYMSLISLLWPNTALLFTNVYTFNFEPRTKVDDAPHDERIADTICSIIERIFVNDRNAVIIVCDSTDHHEQGRNRLFQQWYARLNNKSISKVDKQYQSEDCDIYSSLLIHLDNPDLEEITFAFNQLAETGFIPEED